jgi:NADPH2:quinone reductase
MSQEFKIVEEGGANTMRAWVVTEPGDAIKFTHVQIPEPSPTQLRIRVVASCTNPCDFKRMGTVPAGHFAIPAVMGMDGAGVVDVVGDQVTDYKKGDRVHFFGTAPRNTFGAWAEYALVEASPLVTRVPASMSWEEAAAVPCAAWTAYQALFVNLRLEPGQIIFVAAGAGGVGNFAIQFAKHVGAKVITTASGANVERLRAEGYSVIDYKTHDVKEEVLKLTDGKGVDAVLDMLGEAEAKTSQELLAFGGHLTHIMTQVPPLENSGNFAKALTVSYVLVGLSSKFPGIPAAVNALLTKGAVTVDISKTYTLEEAEKALDAQRGGHVRGKQVISIASDPAVLKTADFKF